MLSSIRCLFSLLNIGLYYTVWKYRPLQRVPLCHAILSYEPTQRFPNAPPKKYDYKRSIIILHDMHKIGQTPAYNEITWKSTSSLDNRTASSTVILLSTTAHISKMDLIASTPNVKPCTASKLYDSKCLYEMWNET